MKKNIINITLLLICLNSLLSQNIYTLAGQGGSGGFYGDGGLSINSKLLFPWGVVVDGSGNIYIADGANFRVRKITSSKIINTIAGIGIDGYSGDGGYATFAEISWSRGLTIDNSGNIYIIDSGNNCIRKINSLGIISTFAGNGWPFGYTGDGGLATLAKFNEPAGIAVDGSGNIYISDSNNNCIRKVDTSGIISTIAGTGVSGYAGDGGNALMAQFSFPKGLAFDLIGNLYVADTYNHRIRKINSSGIITTIAGNGISNYSGDWGLAISAELKEPNSIAIDAFNNLLFTDDGTHTVRKINMAGIITSIAGNGVPGSIGDGGLALYSQLYSPNGIAVDTYNNIYISEHGSHKIRVICNMPGCILGFNTIYRNIEKLTLYPNPNSGIFEIHNTTDFDEIIVTNIFGQTVHQQNITDGYNRIISTNLPLGFYICSYLRNKQFVGNTKFNIE